MLRPAIEKLLYALRRGGVIESFAEYNPGAFSARLAPIRSAVEAMPRRRDARPAATTVQLHGLSSDTIAILRDLAQRSLDALGVKQSEKNVEDEMHRQLGALVRGLGGGRNDEERLRAAIRSAIADYD